MLKTIFFKDLLNAEFPNDKNKTLLGAIMRFINEEITEENINALGVYGKHSTFSSMLYMLHMAQLNEKIEGAEVENVINALMKKKPKIDQSAFYMAIASPIVLDVFLKKISLE